MEGTSFFSFLVLLVRVFASYFLFYFILVFVDFGFFRCSWRWVGCQCENDEAPIDEEEKYYEEINAPIRVCFRGVLLFSFLDVAKYC